jgi:hypothetical protein
VTFLHQTDKFIITGDIAAQTFDSEVTILNPKTILPHLTVHTKIQRYNDSKRRWVARWPALWVRKNIQKSFEKYIPIHKKYSNVMKDPKGRWDMGG